MNVSSPNLQRRMVNVATCAQSITHERLRQEARHACRTDDSELLNVSPAFVLRPAARPPLEVYG